MFTQEVFSLRKTLSEGMNVKKGQQRTSCHSLRYASSNGGPDDIIELMRTLLKSLMTGIF